MKQYNRLIFVDTDDTRRAPMAEMIMKNKFLLGPLTVASRGLVVLFPEPVDQKAEAVLVSNGYTMEGYRSAQLVQEDVGDDVLFLTMEDDQKTKIWEQFECAKNVYTLTEYVKTSGDIPPLYGESLLVYGQCFERLSRLIDDLVIQLNEQEILGNVGANFPPDGGKGAEGCENTGGGK